MEKTKTKKRLLLFTISLLSGFAISGINYFMTPDFGLVLQTNTIRSVSRILPAERYKYEVVNHKDKILNLKANSQQDVEFKIKNTGKLSWNVDSKSSTNTVNPNEDLNLTLNIQAPAIPGFYTQNFKPLVADSNWTFNNKMDLGIVVDGDFDTSYQYELVDAKPLDLMSKVTKPITLKVKNIGTASWFNSGKFPLLLSASQNGNSKLDDDILATMDETEVDPGQVATFKFNMTAPGTIVDYALKFKLAIKDRYVFKDPLVLGINIVSKKVALTFDDGYGDIGPFLDLLNSENIRGTFFMLGCVAEGKPDDMSRIVNEGHMLANHSYCHPDFRTLTDDEIRWQLSRTREIMRGITGKDIYPYFRYPYGAMNERTNGILKEEGWTYIPWTQSTGDYQHHENSEAGRHQVYYYSTLNPPDNAIVLMHIISKSSLAVLPDVIQWYRDHGYTFVTVDQM